MHCQTLASDFLFCGPESPIPTAFLPDGPFDEALMREAHGRSQHIRHQLTSETALSCFYCLGLYPARDITRWIDPAYCRGQAAGATDRKRQTAVCPRCGVDAVLPSCDRRDLTDELLAAMRIR